VFKPVSELKAIFTPAKLIDAFVIGLAWAPDEEAVKVTGMLRGKLAAVSTEPSAGFTILTSGGVDELNGADMDALINVPVLVG